MTEILVAIASWLVAWYLVGVRWLSRRIDSNTAALLLSTTSAASLGIYSLLRQELSAALVVVLTVFAVVQFVFARYALRVLANDRRWVE